MSFRSSAVVAIYFQFVKTSSYTLGSIHLLKTMEDIQMGTNSNYNHNQTPSTPVDYFWAAHTNQKTQFLPVQHQNNQSSAFNSSFSNHFQHGQGSAFSPTGVSFSNTPSPLLHVGGGGSTPITNTNNSSLLTNNSTAVSGFQPHFSSTNHPQHQQRQQQRQQRQYQSQTSRSALPACFDEQLNLSRKRNRKEHPEEQSPMGSYSLTTHTTSSSSSSSSSLSSSLVNSNHNSSFDNNIKSSQQLELLEQDRHDHNFVHGNAKRLKSTSTPTNGHQSSSPHDSSHHNNITTFSTERIQISPMRDSKKRGRNTETDSNPRKASLFHRPWEAYPSARERQFRRDGQTQQHGHAGRRRSKSARYQYETGN